MQSLARPAQACDRTEPFPPVAITLPDFLLGRGLTTAVAQELARDGHVARIARAIIAPLVGPERPAASCKLL